MPLNYNFILNNQGRYLFDFFVFRENNEIFYIDIHNDSADKFLKRLSMYKLRSALNLENVSSDFSKEQDIYSYGCLSKILQLLKLPDGTVKVLVEGIERVKIKSIKNEEKKYLNCEIEIVTTVGDTDQSKALATSLIKKFAASGVAIFPAQIAVFLSFFFLNFFNYFSNFFSMTMSGINNN